MATDWIGVCCHKGFENQSWVEILMLNGFVTIQNLIYKNDKGTHKPYKMSFLSEYVSSRESLECKLPFFLLTLNLCPVIALTLSFLWL